MTAYKDASETLENRVEDLLARFTTEEKLQWVTGKTFWSWRDIERLDVPEIMMTDGPHGVTCGTGDPAMSYPTGVSIASTWNPELIQELGVELGKEMHAKGYDILLGPAVDIQRAPKFGRNYECYSEDPVLAGKIGAAWVRGVQSMGIGTTTKHVAAYSTSNFMDDVHVDEATLREIYLKPFEIIANEADPTGMMTSYNQINSKPTSQHPLQRDIIKAEWGFKGFVISDWRGLLDVEGIANGQDVEMPGPGKVATPENLQKEIDAGRLTWEAVDDSIRRRLRFMVQMGHFDEQRKVYEAAENSASQQEIARRVAEESAVLLKNNDNVLPLKKDVIKKIAILGPNAAEARLSGGGSAAVSPFYAISPLEGLRNYLGDSTEIVYHEGCSFKGNMPLVEATAISNMQAKYYKSNDLSSDICAEESCEQIDCAWGWVSPTQGVPKNDWSAEWNGILTAPISGEYELGLSYQDGGARLYVDGELIIDDWAALPAGDFEAGYRDLSESKKIHLEAGKAYQIRINYRKYSNRAALRFEWAPPSNENSIEVAARIASESDVALVCVGLSNQFEGGGCQRDDLDLPGEQNELIKAVIAANPRTVVVLIGGSAVLMEEWAEDVAGLLQCWYPGLEGGNALARLLYAEVTPSGKLPNTLPKRYEDVPAFGNEEPVDGVVKYDEGQFIGYRHYDAKDIAPRYGFGFGLSYTKFKSTVPVLEGKIIRLTLRNIGDYDGAEVIQVYACQSDPSRPLRALKSFQKVFLTSGAEASVELPLPDDYNVYWHLDQKKWVEQDVSLEVRVGETYYRKIH